MPRRAALFGATTMVACMGCLNVLDDERDIVIWNASGCSLASVTLDGIDRGPIGNGEQRVFDDVGPGVHSIEVFRRSTDTEPCDEHETEFLSDDEDEFWTVDCHCDD